MLLNQLSSQPTNHIIQWEQSVRTFNGVKVVQMVTSVRQAADGTIHCLTELMCFGQLIMVCMYMII